MINNCCCDSEVHLDTPITEKQQKAIERVIKAWEEIFSALEECYSLNWKDDPNFEGTPRRIAKALVLERCNGINSEQLCKELLNITFPTTYSNLVVTMPIVVHSLCPHHFENVEYTVQLGYIPMGKCVGLSKIGRLIKLYGRQPILQEDFTRGLATIFDRVVTPKGVGVVVRGRHNCMIARGLQEPNVSVITMEFLGELRDNESARRDFLWALEGSKLMG